MEAQGASVLEVMLVALVEGDDNGHVPTLSGQAEGAHSIMSRVQRRGLDGQTKGFATVVEGSEAVDAVVAVTVGCGERYRQLTAVPEAIGCQFVEAVTVDSALAVAVPAPEG